MDRDRAIVLSVVAGKLNYEGRTWTARDVATASATVASVLSDIGVRQGDRVAYLGFNSPTLLHLYLACARVGAIFVPMNFRLAAHEVRAVLAAAGPRVVVSEEGHCAVADQVAADLPVDQWLLIDDDPAVPVQGEPGPRWDLLSRLVAAASAPAEPVVLTDDDVAALMFTSGTTGLPKGVILTHGNIWWNAVNVDTVVHTQWPTSLILRRRSTPRCDRRVFRRESPSEDESHR